MKLANHCYLGGFPTCSPPAKAGFERKSHEYERLKESTAKLPKLAFFQMKFQSRSFNGGIFPISELSEQIFLLDIFPRKELVVENAVSSFNQI